MLTISEKGFASVRETISVDGQAETSLHVQLGIAPVSEIVNVTDNASTVNVDTVTLTTQINRVDIERTPGADRTNSLAMITDCVPGAYESHDMLPCSPLYVRRVLCRFSCYFMVVYICVGLLPDMPMYYAKHIRIIRKVSVIRSASTRSSRSLCDRITARRRTVSNRTPIQEPRGKPRYRSLLRRIALLGLLEDMLAVRNVDEVDDLVLLSQAGIQVPLLKQGVPLNGLDANWGLDSIRVETDRTLHPGLKPSSEWLSSVRIFNIRSAGFQRRTKQHIAHVALIDPVHDHSSAEGQGEHLQSCLHVPTGPTESDDANAVRIDQTLRSEPLDRLEAALGSNDCLLVGRYAVPVQSVLHLQDDHATRRERLRGEGGRMGPSTR
nr:hypothetical protein [Bryocella elongata]